MNMPTGGGLPVGPIGSSKSVIDQQDELKHWPDDKLIAEMQSPTGIAPQYLLFTEVSRREDVRNRYQSAQEQSGMSMAEEMIQSKTQPPPLPQQQMPPEQTQGMPPEQMQGIGAMPPGPTPQGPMPQGPMPPMMDTPPMPMDGGMPMPPGPQSFANGGLVKGYHKGGAVMPNHDELYPDPHSHSNSVGIGSGDELVGDSESFLLRNLNRVADASNRAAYSVADTIAGVPKAYDDFSKWNDDQQNRYTTSIDVGPVGNEYLASKGYSAVQQGVPDVAEWRIAEKERLARQRLIARQESDQRNLNELTSRAGGQSDPNDPFHKFFPKNETPEIVDLPPKPPARDVVPPAPDHHAGLLAGLDERGEGYDDIDKLRAKLESVYAPPKRDNAEMLLAAAGQFLGAPNVWKGGKDAALAIAPMLGEERKAAQESRRSKFLAESTLAQMEGKRNDARSGRRANIELAQAGSRASMSELRENLSARADNVIAEIASRQSVATSRNEQEMLNALSDEASSLRKTIDTANKLNMGSADPEDIARLRRVEASWDNYKKKIMGPQQFETPVARGNG